MYRDDPWPLIEAGIREEWRARGNINLERLREYYPALRGEIEDFILGFLINEADLPDPFPEHVEDLISDIMENGTLPSGPSRYVEPDKEPE